MPHKGARPGVSKVARVQLIKLGIRSALFIAVVIVYAQDKHLLVESIYGRWNSAAFLLGVIWIIFAAEMTSRFFPLKYESIGSQKLFGNNYVEKGKWITVKGSTKTRKARQAILIASVWIILNAGIGGLYFTGLIDEGFLLVISLFYAVADIVCILFYCPFQSLIMKNRCCVSCRIYNWDFIMMFTPLFLILSWYTLSLAGIALLVFLRWEIAFSTHPERFFEETNQNLACSHCREKLCGYKNTTTSS